MRTTVPAVEVKVGDVVELDAKVGGVSVGPFVIRIVAIEHRINGVKLSGRREDGQYPGLHSWGRAYDQGVVRLDP